MFSPAARISLPPDWRGTADELAQKATEFLLDCGFDAKFGGSERLVRYYVTRGVLTPPAKDEVDRRKAVFGPLQFRQLVLARLLAERGWDLGRIIDQFQTPKGPKLDNELDTLLNQLASPTEAEKLLFQSRRDRPDDLGSEYASERAAGDSRSVVTKSARFSPQEFGEDPNVRESVVRRLVASARGKTGGLDTLARTAEKLLKEPGLTGRESASLRELAEMARLAFRHEGKKERWTRVVLAPWCEVNIRIGKDSELSESQKAHMVKEFSRLIDDYDTRSEL